VEPARVNEHFARHVDSPATPEQAERQPGFQNDFAKVSHDSVPVEPRWLRAGIRAKKNF